MSKALETTLASLAVTHLAKTGKLYVIEPTAAPAVGNVEMVAMPRDDYLELKNKVEQMRMAITNTLPALEMARRRFMKYGSTDMIAQAINILKGSAR